MLLRLVIQPLPGATFDFPIEGDCATFGRSSSCDLPLPSRFVSRRHARIFSCDGEMLLEDLGSHNGTKLNGTLISEPTPIVPGDVIAVSGFRLTVHELVPSGLIASSNSNVGASAVSHC